MKARITFAASMAAFALVATCDALGAELEYMGKTLPGASDVAGPPTPLPNWESVALDRLPGKAIRDVLSKAVTDQGALATRGPKDAAIYRNAAPAVVLIATSDGALGSGSYLGDGYVLTNWHVVTPHQTVGVLFKPVQDGAAADAKSMVRAEVIKTDQPRDLALIRVALAPPSLKPLQLGNEKEIEVGADVHAIGHPTGLTWSYTKGLISRLHKNFPWKNKEEAKGHRATVIQTQTPINPGNSGGPLLGDSGRILGVNSFSAGEGEGLNFAVSVEDVADFLGTKSSPDSAAPQLASLPPALSASPPSNCKPQTLYDSKNDRTRKPGSDHILAIDSNCDNIPDITIVTPADPKKSILALIDSNYDGKVDIVVEDVDRDGRWDRSLIDVDHDGVPDLVGYHPDGKLLPSRFEQYAQN